MPKQMQGTKETANVTQRALRLENRNFKKIVDGNNVRAATKEREHAAKVQELADKERQLAAKVQELVVMKNELTENKRLLCKQEFKLNMDKQMLYEEQQELDHKEKELDKREKELADKQKQHADKELPFAEDVRDLCSGEKKAAGNGGPKVSASVREDGNLMVYLSTTIPPYGQQLTTCYCIKPTTDIRGSTVQVPLLEKQ